MIQREQAPLYEIESPRTRKRRERIERQEKERKEMVELEKHP